MCGYSLDKVGPIVHMNEKEFNMKVIVDNYTVPEIKVQVVCTHCKSQLLVDQVSDLLIGTHKDGDQRDGSTWDVRHLEIQCPLCLKNFRVYDEKKFPEAALRYAYDFNGK